MPLPRAFDVISCSSCCAFPLEEVDGSKCLFPSAVDILPSSLGKAQLKDSLPFVSRESSLVLRPEQLEGADVEDFSANVTFVAVTFAS